MTALKAECVSSANLQQRLLPEDGKGKARADIQIDASLRDDRNDNDPDFWKHTDATRQFQQACWPLHIYSIPPHLCFLQQPAIVKGSGLARGDNLSMQISTSKMAARFTITCQV